MGNHKEIFIKVVTFIDRYYEAQKENGTGKTTENNEHNKKNTAMEKIKLWLSFHGENSTTNHLMKWWSLKFRDQVRPQGPRELF